MDLTTLRDKQTTIESSFNDLVKQKQDIDSELLKLQGEYRVISDLIDNFKVKETKNAK
jgi:hypothetical protein